MRPPLQYEVWSVYQRDTPRPRRVYRLWQPGLQLAGIHFGAARAACGPVGERGVLPDVVWQLDGDRQPRDRSSRLLVLLHHRPDECASAERWWREHLRAD